jgi:hypothetical protein
VKRFIALFILLVVAVSIGGCTSSADRVSKNLSVEAEKFNVPRRIVGVNGITDKVEFEVQGFCSIEGDGLGNLNALIVICKDRTPGQKPTYTKHYVGMSDNMFFISTQLRGINVSEFRTKIVLKPQNIVPDLDLVTG